MEKLKTRCIILFITVLGLVNVMAQDQLDIEIRRLQRELGQIQAEREKNRKEALSEAKEFSSYRERTSAQKHQITSFTDSIRTQAGSINLKRDSLAAALNSIEVSTRQQELLRNALRDKLLTACDGLLSAVQNLPPMVSLQNSNALQYLKTELQSGNVEPVEALGRLLQIARGVQDQSSDIQVMESSSPLSEIPGTVYRLRVGTFFEAIVDSRGEKVAFWYGVDKNGKQVWHVSTNKAEAASVYKAVKVREGKAVPELVELPLGRSE